MSKLKHIKKIHSENLFFFAPYYVFVLVTSSFYLLNQKGTMILNFSKNREPFLNDLFINASIAGEGIYFAYLLGLLALIRIKYALLGLITFLGTGAVTQILKRIFDAPRPAKWFPDIEKLNYLSDIKIYKYLSFPSGHTTSGFAMMLFLALIVPNRPAKSLFLIGAIIIGTSRIYLAQHFLEDVIVGSMIGTFGTLIIFSLFEGSEKITDSNWYNFSIYNKVFKRNSN